MKGRLHDPWCAELLRRALTQTNDIELAMEAVALAIQECPTPPPDDAFLRTLPGVGEALRILDAAVEELQPDLDAARAVAGTFFERRPPTELEFHQWPT